MDYRYLGRTGLQVSPLCLGTMNFGPQTGEADSFAIMDRAFDAGINFFDTANGYGGGETEQILGRWFAQGGGRREKVVLATKVYGNVAGDWPNDSKLSARHIRDACDASLRRLQTDHIDLYQMHHVDRNTPWEEIWQAMDLLVAQGKVIYVGSSNFAAWNIVAANEAAKRRSTLRPRLRAEPLQPQDPGHRARGRPGLRGLRHRRHPLEPARGRAARPARSPRPPRAGGPTTGCGQPTIGCGPRSTPGRRSAPSSANGRPTSPWPGCCPTRW